MIKKAIISLIILNVFLLGVAVALWQLPIQTLSISTSKDTSSTERPITIKRALSFWWIFFNNGAF